MASVIGAEFDLGLLERVVEAADAGEVLDEIEEAEAGHLVVELGHAHYRFSHAMVRDTIYSGLSTTRKGRLHRRVAEAIETLPSIDTALLLPALAHHFGEAAASGCALKAADYAVAAARQALSLAAWEDAAAHLERGLRALDADRPPDLERRCDMLILLAETWSRYFNPARAFDVAALAVAAARTLDSPERLARAAYWWVRHHRINEPQVVVELCQEALAGLGDGLPAVRAKLLAVLSRVEDAGGRDSGPLSREALRVARCCGDPEALGVALVTACARLRGSPHAHEYLALAEELVSAAPPDGWDGWRDGYSYRAMGRLCLGDRPGFEAAVADCRRFGSERRFWYYRWIAGVWSATLALLDGRFAEAEALAAQAHDLATGDWNMAPVLLVRQHFRMTVERGEFMRARSIAELLGQDGTNNHMHQAMLLYARAELEGVDSGRPMYEAFTDEGLGGMSPERRPVTLAYRCEVAAALGGPARAARLHEELSPYGGQIVIGGMGEGCMGAVDRYLGMLATVMGRWDDAEAYYVGALAQEFRLGSPPLAARTQYWFARMLLARPGSGESAKTRDLLISAQDTASGLGMARLAADSTELLGRV